ncbi:MAG: trimeric autotransporter adhesin [Solirubrobacterales bacterium]|jgi:CSLREA domain-containing protein|nr:trimeric autotransporter adhesin [Solirubrobacterales bacterium]
MRFASTSALAGVVFLLACGTAQAGLPIVVNETGDESDPTPDGVCDVAADPGSQCTLRAAIESANTFFGADAINFGIPGSGVHTIAVQSPLPALQTVVVMDGYTQAGSSPNTDGSPQPLTTQIKVFLDGDALAVEGAGLGFSTGSNGSTVSGLAIGNFPAAAIRAEVPMTIQGNFIGTNAAGTSARPNGLGFLGLSGAMNAQLGGPDFDDPNLISGNLGEAIVANAAVEVHGNYIGTERDGKSPLPNTTEEDLFAVLLSGDDSDKVTRNIIANGSAGGISVPDSNAGSLLSANRMFKNDGLGIDLGEDGVTPNDDMDPDPGPNGLQNFPIITKAKRLQTTTKVEFELNSLPNEGFNVEFFQADGKSRLGKIYLGGAGFTTDDDGNASFELELAKPKQGKFVTATATRIAGGDLGATSEFAKPRKVK